MRTRTHAQVCPRYPAAPRPVATFFIHPEPSRLLTVGVEVFRTVGEFRAFVRAESRAIRLRSRTRGLVGQCVGIDVTRRGRRHPCFAILRFPRQHLTVSTLTHEAFHATMRWAQRRNIPAIPTMSTVSNITDRHRPTYVTSLEEQCATVHDRICRELVLALQAHELLPL